MSVSLFSSTLFTSFALFFFFNDTATTEIYTLSLHDALPISRKRPKVWDLFTAQDETAWACATGDRKSTRLNSSHQIISYAVFCLKKKKKPYSRSASPRTARRSAQTHTPTPS